MKQIKVSLDDEVRAQLEGAADKAGRSLSEEVRLRLERSLGNDKLDPQTRDLIDAITPLSLYVSMETGRAWHTHAAAAAVLLHALMARIIRITAKRLTGDLREAAFAPGELPETRLFAAGSDDPRDIGLVIESIEFHTSQPQPSREPGAWRRKVDEELRQKGEKR
jgi:hypothetical protein